MDWILLLAIIAVFLGFILQGIAGFAASLISFPILLHVMDLQEASVLMGLLYVCFSAIYAYTNWRLIDRKIIVEFLPGIVIGMVIGVMLLKFGNPIVLKKILGIFIILYIVYTYVRSAKVRIYKRLGIVFGFIGGIIGGLYSAGGPLLITYIHNKLTDPRRVRATVIGSLAVVNFFRLPLFIYNGMVTVELMYLALMVFPFFLLALYIGHKLYDRIDSKLLEKILTVVLFLAALSLIMG